MKRGAGPKADPARTAAWQQRSRERAAQKARDRRTAAPPVARKPAPRTPTAPKRWRQARAASCGACWGTERLSIHHVTYAQHVEAQGGDVWDPANALTLCERCHLDHHARVRTIGQALLPDVAISFCTDLLGPYAFDYLRRYYPGPTDPRVAAIVGQ